MIDPPIPEEYVHLIEVSDDMPVTAEHIAKGMATEPGLAKAFRYVSKGWPANPEREMSMSFGLKEDLSTLCGDVLRGCLVVVPKIGSLRQCLVQDLHS